MDTEAVRVRQEIVSDIADTFDKMQHQASAKLPYESYTRSIEHMIEHLTTHPSAAVFLGDIAEAEDDLMRHSASVAYLALLLGMKLESYIVRERKHIDPARAKDLANLGVGAMLHDIGVLLLPPAVRSGTSESGDDRDPQWQEHPALGFQHVRGKVEPSAATVVLNHHQRADGSGYAGKGMPVLSDKAMHVYARIAAVADHFDTLRRPPGVPPQPTVWALSAMLSEPERDKFDPVVLRALIEAVPAYPPRHHRSPLRRAPCRGDRSQPHSALPPDRADHPRPGVARSQRPALRRPPRAQRAKQRALRRRGRRVRRLRAELRRRVRPPAHAGRLRSPWFSSRFPLAVRGRGARRAVYNPDP